MDRTLTFLSFLLFAAVVLLGAPLLGDSFISPRTLLGTICSGCFSLPSLNQLQTKIFFQIRLPRVLLAFLSGASLSVCGVAFQAFFRNPLATPFTLGVASGASVGASVYIVLGFGITLLGISGISLFAFAGALATTFLVYGLARLSSSFSSYTLLLAGISISIFFSSFLLLFQYIGQASETVEIVRWTMGQLEVVGYGKILGILPFVIGGGAPLLLLHREFDLLLTGEEFAASKGLNVRWTQQIVFFAVSVTTGGVVSTCGPIGFVGLICPHICRRFVGNKHGGLLYSSLLFGGGFLVVCDTVGRTVIYPAEIPVGIVTSLIGGPFLLWLILRDDSLS